ncbi:hypothetical protein BH20CHL2_BH20CHL2_06200 [soil metagenome]
MAVDGEIRPIPEFRIGYYVVLLERSMPRLFTVPVGIAGNRHSLTEPRVMPFTKYLCITGYSAISGRIAITIPAI